MCYSLTERKVMVDPQYLWNAERKRIRIFGDNSTSDFELQLMASPNSKHSELMRNKGFYPYEWVDENYTEKFNKLFDKGTSDFFVCRLKDCLKFAILLSLFFITMYFLF